MVIKSGEIISAADSTESHGNPLAQLAYEQVKSDSSNWTNTDYLGADIFSDSNGAKNTVDTGNSTGIYDSDSDSYGLGFTDEASGDTTHDPDTLTDASNFFDGDDGTYASSTSFSTEYLGKTFGSKYIGWVKVKATATITNGADEICDVRIHTYNGSTWSEVATLTSGTSSCSYNSYYFLDTTTQGIRISVRTSSNPNSPSPTCDKRWYTLEYGNFDSSSTVETNTIIDEIIPKSIVVYGKTDIPTDTSITVDVSDDGGSTWSLTDQELNTYIDTSTFTTGNLALKFNLATTDTSATPKLYGYGVAITDA